MDTEPQYVVVAEADDSDEPVELPCEQDATLLLSTVQAQFPGALGLKYRSPSGNAWRGIRLVESSLHPPAEGWSTTTYIITLPKTDSVKRKMEESPIKEPEAKLVRTSGAASNDEEPKANKNDLIVLGLSYTATESDMRTYFEQFGVVELAEIKNDFRSGKSKGFGFIRFAEKSVAQTVLDKTHEICGRRAEVKKPKGKETPNKLFVGRLPQGTSEEELKTYFECYGETSDVYMPKPHRGFCFITYRDPDDAATVRNLNPPPKLHNNQLNITFAEPKQEQRRESGGFGGSSYGFGDRSDFRSSRGGASEGGDWDCRSCRASNFARRTECFKCRDPKPSSGGGYGASYESSRRGNSRW